MRPVRRTGAGGWGPLVVAVGCVAAPGCDRNKVAVTDCYAFDIAVIDSNRGVQLKAVLLGVRTKPEADTLDAKDIELVSSDGKTFPVHDRAGMEPEAWKIGSGQWFPFAVPEELVDKGDLALRVKSTGRSVPLPSPIPRIKINDLDKR
jgi:hypothetical protein